MLFQLIFIYSVASNPQLGYYKNGIKTQRLCEKVSKAEAKELNEGLDKSFAKDGFICKLTGTHFSNLYCKKVSVERQVGYGNTTYDSELFSNSHYATYKECRDSHARWLKITQPKGE